MIQSMTGYARFEVKSHWGNAVWEIRSLNQRYLETFIRLPEHLRALEPLVRERLRRKLTRGKIECFLRFEANNTVTDELQINEHLVEQVFKATHKIIALAGECDKINPIQVLQWPGVLEAPEQNMDIINRDLMHAFDSTLDSLIKSRADEGASIKTLIEQRLDAISDEIKKVRTKLPEVMKWQRDRITSKFEDAKIELDPNRLEQELVIIAQKSDVAEELDRIDIHLEETRRILASGGAIGRRLDFMMQEFNRESNTLGSKSINNDITSSSVELKVLIEQAREQVQNLE